MLISTEASSLGYAQTLILPSCAPPRYCRFAMVRCHLSTLTGRDKLRISDVSRLTGLNRSTVSLYKETATRLDVAAIDALCHLFRCSVGELLEHCPEPAQDAGESAA
ncbi:helix-turn-helix domain-containing protein [Roseateles sp. GG27B]